MIVLDGRSLTCAQVARLGRLEATAELGPAGLARAAAAAATVREVMAAAGESGQAVYGRTTGVGYNRRVEVAADDAETGLRLVRSHAAGAGPSLRPETARAMLAVRANQIAAGGSGVDPGVLPVLARCVNLGVYPAAGRFGAIGTGDLTALAAAALCLLGEREWAGIAGEAASRPPLFAFEPGDLLAFLSSGAATLAEAAIACADLIRLNRAAVVIAALSHLAVRGSAEPYAAAVQHARAHPGQAEVAAALRALLGSDELRPAARVQDPYAFRALPQVHGTATDAVSRAREATERELNAAAENPLVDTAGRRLWHNGNFHSGYLALALDTARAAVFQTAALSAARLAALLDDRVTGLRAFLAGDVAPSSGLMMTEYTAQSALAEIRRLAAPASLGTAVLSLGAEEHAGFATQAAAAAAETVPAYRVVLACELVAAVRALRQQGVRPETAELAGAFDRCATLPQAITDRPPDEDLAIAGPLVDALAAGTAS